MIDDPPRCPVCGGMLSGDTQRLKCVSPPLELVPLEPDEWSAGCGIVLEWKNGIWTRVED